MEYIFHVKTTIDHFGKKLENVSEPKLDHTVNLGHTQHPSQSLAENSRKGIFLSLTKWRDMRKGIRRARLCVDGGSRRRRKGMFHCLVERMTHLKV